MGSDYHLIAIVPLPRESELNAFVFLPICFMSPL